LPRILKILARNCTSAINDHRYFQSFWQKTPKFLVKSYQSWVPIHFSSFFAKNYAQDEIFELQHAKVSGAVSLYVQKKTFMVTKIQNRSRKSKWFQIDIFLLQNTKYRDAIFQANFKFLHANSEIQRFFNIFNFWRLTGCFLSVITM
jgi:hypothetical protein